MSKSVEWVPLSSVLKKIVDNRGKTVPTVELGFPLIATNCIKETSVYPTFENIRYISEETLGSWFRAHLEPNDILFVNKGTPGRVCLVPDPVPFCAAQDMIGLRVDSTKIDYRYLFAFLRSNWVKQTIANNHVGLVIPHFRKQDLDTLSVPMRSRKEQEGIGELYLLLSRMIELNNQINAALEAMTKLLYDYWFVQFDFPTTAAQAASLDRPTLEGKPYRSSGGKMVNNSILNRQIPEGWQPRNLGDCIARIIDHRGKTPTKLGGEWSSKADAIVALSAKIVKGGKLIGIENANRVDNELYEKWMPHKLEEGDVLMTSEAPAGECYFILGKTDYCLSQRLFAMRANRSIVQPTYLYQELFAGHAHSEILGSLSGSTVFGIRQDVLRSIRILVPDLEIQKLFERIVLPNFRQIRTLEQQNQELTELRDWLLPMLMNGQVTIS